MLSSFLGRRSARAGAQLAVRTLRQRAVRLQSTLLVGGDVPSSFVLRNGGGLGAPQHRALFSSEGDEVTIDVPIMGDSVVEGTILEWEKEVGDYIAVDDIVVTIETDKVSVEVRSENAGTLTAQHAEEDETVDVGAQLYAMTLGGEAPAAAATPEPAAAAEPVAAAAAAAPTPPPAAPKAAPAAAAAAPAGAAPLFFSGRNEERQKMSPLRKKVATVLKEGQNTAAMLTTFQEVDMSGLMSMRSKYKDEFEAVHGAKLGFLSPFIKAAASSLITEDFKVVNALMDQPAGEVVYRDYVDIGIAVAGPKGLLVPVIRDCHNLSLAGIERQFATLVQKAQDRSISMEELVGGTFSISNGGTFGSMMGTPLINMPQSAILGMHATKMRPTVVNGEIVARPIMYLALTYDHRLIDGREAVLFLCSIRDKIEDPRRLALEL